MSAMSNYLENKLVDHIFRGQSFSAPTNLYVALFTAAPDDAGNGTEVSTTNTGYARVTVACSLANWAGTQSAGSTTASSGTGGVTSNNAAITFPTPTGGANWGLVTHFGIFDASTNGNLLFHGALTASKNVNQGDPAPSFTAASLQLTFA